MFFCEHCKKYRNFIIFYIADNLRKWTVSGDPWEIFQKICGNCPPTENIQHRELEEIPGL